jgi:hypothetical protein
MLKLSFKSQQPLGRLFCFQQFFPEEERGTREEATRSVLPPLLPRPFSFEKSFSIIFR